MHIGGALVSCKLLCTTIHCQLSTATKAAANGPCAWPPLLAPRPLPQPPQWQVATAAAAAPAEIDALLLPLLLPCMLPQRRRRTSQQLPTCAVDTQAGLAVPRRCSHQNYWSCHHGAPQLTSPPLISSQCHHFCHNATTTRHRHSLCDHELS